MTVGCAGQAGRPVRIVQVGGDAASPSVSDAFEGADEPVEVVARPGPDEVVEAIGPAVDCVVTAHRLGSRDGLDVIRSVRDAYDGLPVVLATEDASADTIRTAVQREATVHVERDVLRETPAKFRNRLFTAVEHYHETRRQTHRQRVTDLVSRIDDRLVCADSRSRVESAVCEEISESDPYRFAWIGATGQGSAEIHPRAAAGFDDGYLDDATVSADDSEYGQGPAGRALRTGDIAVTDDIESGVDFAPWADGAPARGHGSVGAVPLTHEGDAYGVLVLYADRPYAFGECERSQLAQLGTDISRAIRQAALRTDRWKFRQMVEQAGEAMFLTDESGAVTYVNPAFERLTGRESDAIEGTRLRDLDVDVASEQAAAELVESIRHRRDWTGEIEIERDGGENRTVSLVATPLDRDGEESRYVGIGTDVTDRKTYEERVEAQQNKLELLNRLVRHDIRNDAQVLFSMTGLLEDHVDEGGREYLERIAQKSEHIADLTRSARDLTGSITDPDAETTHSVELDSVLSEEVDSVETTYGVDVTREPTQAGQTVRGDEMLHSVFRNLLQNAVEHSDSPDVNVDITTEVREDTVVVRVADDGPGISDDRKETLLEYGEKGPDSAGSGIGLFLVDTLVDNYGGTLTVEDNDPAGTVFEVQLQQG